MLTLALLAALAAQSGGGWETLHFLEGDWVGIEGSGQPGKAAGGGFSLHRELGGKILVRRNRAEYAATKDRAAFVHEDLMVIYPDAKRAVYFDSEGHVIHYTIEADGKSAVMVSEPDASAPRYRLSYRSAGADSLSILFEVAPPGKDFQKYIEAKVRRK